MVLIRNCATTRLLAILLGLVAVQIASADSDVILLKNDAAGITVRYKTAPIYWAEMKTPDQVYHTPYVAGTGMPWPEGAPQLPARVIWLAIPPEATLYLTGTAPYGVNTTSNVPAPVPRTEPNADGSVLPVYEENPEYYGSSSPFPSVWVEMQAPETYRDLRVVRLLVYPCRLVSGGSGTLELDSMDVSISFQGVSPLFSGSGFSRPLEDEFYQDLIANWQGPAKTWKLPRYPQTEIADPWPAGDLYKMEIDETGIYKLTYDDLINAGVNLSGLDPHKIRIFNNGGEALPQDLITPRPQEPIENAIKIIGEEDGEFNSGDMILFYGKSVHEWEPVWYSPEQRYRFQHYQNHYTDHNVYWLNINPSGPNHKMMESLGNGGTPQFSPSTTKAYYSEEKDLYAIYDSYNLPLDMPNFYGDLFSGAMASRSFSFYLEELVNSTNALLILRLKCADTLFHRFNVYLNNFAEPIYTTPNKKYVIEETIPVDPSVLQTGTNTLRLEHLSTGTVYLDYFELEYTRNLTTAENLLQFFSPNVDGLVQYQINGLFSPWIFDVTEFENVKVIPTQANNFKDDSQTLSPKRYLAVNNNGLRSPLSVVEDRRDGDEYVNLRTTLGADVLVIAADQFYDAMAAYEDYRENEAPTRMEVLRVRVSDIYDEYGWGLVDPAAIRDFLKTTLPIYNWAVSPLFVLFAGDGDFDYKNKLSSADANWVIPFEDGARCTDDWYSYFEPTDNSYAYPQLATGRWPIHDAAEIELLMDRLKAYEGNQDFGPWRDRILFVADDEYGQGGVYTTWETNHVLDTESIAESGDIPDIINVQKIYMTEYPVSYDPAGGGRRKPEANADLIRTINDGCLLVNYMGHGNPTVWAHEHVFLQSRDLPLLQNGSRLPLFVAATCDWAYWDNPFSQAMPEIMLTLDEGGGIAAIAATRVTGANSNYLFLQNFYQELFSKSTGARLGEALMRGKARQFAHNLGQSSNNANAEKYHLLGDPVMRLAMPQLAVQIDPISSDTLTALGNAFVSGVVQTSSGGSLESFDGIAHLQVFDVRIPVHYGFNNADPPPTVTYTLPGNLIFRGDASIVNGHFQTNFVVPVDISYGGVGGRYSVYAYSDDIDGAGANDDVIFGESAVTLQDSIPPVVRIYFDSPGFRSGDQVGSEATMYVEVVDSNGVNLTGSVGHGITVTIDDQSPVDLTDSFSYYLDSHTSGRAEYKFKPGEVTAGSHLAQAIAWDAANNPNTAETNFDMLGSEELSLTDLFNYPNPFKNVTRFTFCLTEPAEITIKIYTVAGRLVKTISGIQGEASFNWDDPLLVWDGRDEKGDLLSNGAYIYKVLAASYSGTKDEETGKLIVMR